MSKEIAKVVSTTGFSPTQQRIADALGSPKIKDCSPEDIRGMLLYIITLMGIPERNDPIKDEAGNKIGLSVIINYIQTYWENKRIEDIRLAFEFLLDNRYESNKKGDKLDTNLYDRPLSVEYLSSVMVAYENYKRKKLAPLETNANLTLALAPPPKATPKDYYESLLAWVGSHRKIPVGWAWMDVWKHIQSEGLILDTLEQKKMFMASVKEMIQREAVDRKNKTISLKDFVSQNLAPKELNDRCIKERIITFLKEKYKL